MIIISDTSPISGLLIIGRLDILNRVYGKVIIPQVVLDELLVLESYGYDLQPIREASWLKIAEPTNQGMNSKTIIS